MTIQIAIVDPDKIVVAAVEKLLRSSGFVCMTFDRADGLLSRLHTLEFDFILSEYALPDMQGTELCKQVLYNEGTAHIPFVFLTSVNTEMDRVVAFSIGATDYIVKPFSDRELVLRIKAILRRTAQLRPATQISNGIIQINLQNHQATVGDQPLALTRLEFKLLAALTGAGGHVLTREQLIAATWGTNSNVLDRTVDAHIRSLRKKMGDSKDELETVQGVGYRINQHSEFESVSRTRENSLSSPNRHPHVQKMS